MSELENQMKFDMELRGYSPLTIKNYILCVKNFAEHYEKSLEQLGENEVRNYLHYCITERKLCEGTVNYMRSAIKFLYTKTLDREWRSEKLRSIKERRKLPVILSQSEIKLSCYLLRLNIRIQFYSYYEASVMKILVA